ncbi:MAG: hypothetical protein U0Z44_07750 [Kouleothrix sp.]
MGGNAYDGIGGGGLMAMESDLRLAHVTFRGNETSTRAGMGLQPAAASGVQRGHVTLRAVDFSDNRSEIGGGMFMGRMTRALRRSPLRAITRAGGAAGSSKQGSACSSSTPPLKQNTASGGGGLFLSGSGSMLVNTVFRYNTAYVGGAVMLYGGDHSLPTALIAQNRVSAHGGGMYNTKHRLPHTGGRDHKRQHCRRKAARSTTRSTATAVYATASSGAMLRQKGPRSTR